MNPTLSCCAALAALALATPSLAAPVADFEGPAFRLPLPISVVSGKGKKRTTSRVLPAGSILTRVQMRSADPETSVTEGSVLLTGETVTFTADGVVIASAVPETRSVNLQTNVGAIGGVVFEAAGAAWFVPRTGSAIAGASVVTVDSTLASGTTGGFAAINNGLFPVGAQAVTGRLLFESSIGEPATQAGQVRNVLLFDADGQRSTTDSAFEELVVSDFTELPPGSALNPLYHGFFNGLVAGGSGGGEGIARVRFKTGESAELRALRWRFTQNFGASVRYTLFDANALATLGRTIDDIALVESYTLRAHTLDWAALGFAP